MRRVNWKWTRITVCCKRNRSTETFNGILVYWEQPKIYQHLQQSKSWKSVARFSRGPGGDYVRVKNTPSSTEHELRRTTNCGAATTAVSKHVRNTRITIYPPLIISKGILVLERTSFKYKVVKSESVSVRNMHQSRRRLFLLCRVIYALLMKFRRIAA